jgi:hypothetical protein
MKLELKHITTYLPFELRVNLLRPGFERYNVPLLTFEIRRNAVEGIYLMYDGVSYSFEHVQPILQPLSSYKNLLDKPISDLNCDLPDQAYISRFANQTISLASVRYLSYSVMAENKVDMFGLIDAVLAVDANSLNAKTGTKFKNL